MKANQSKQFKSLTSQNIIQPAQLPMAPQPAQEELTDEQLAIVLGGAPTSYGIWGPCLNMPHTLGLLRPSMPT